MILYLRGVCQTCQNFLYREDLTIVHRLHGSLFNGPLHLCGNTHDEKSTLTVNNLETGINMINK